MDYSCDPKQIPSLPLSFWVFPSPALLPTQQDVRQVWFGNTGAPPLGCMWCFCYCLCPKMFLDFGGSFLSQVAGFFVRGRGIMFPALIRLLWGWKFERNAEGRALKPAWSHTNVWFHCCVRARKGKGIKWQKRERQVEGPLSALSIWQYLSIICSESGSFVGMLLLPFIHSFLICLTNIPMM